jgi:acetolactate synthase I/II/III large subunit
LTELNGAQALIRTLVDSGVDVCFTNPGTSEMHFVAALDTVPEMRGILCLFEGVATGAADGYARMADKPACTLLHLGPGLGNGLANLHNARKAGTPIVNIVGDHATYHKQYDAQLESDIETVARNVSSWIRSTQKPEDTGKDAAEAVAAAIGPPGSVATLILPADSSWLDGAVVAKPVARRAPSAVSGEVVATIAKAVSSDDPVALLLGGAAVREAGLVAASRVATASGAKLLGETFPTRLQRGAGRPAIERVQYLAEFAMAQLEGVRHLVLVEAKAPVSFFAYPGKPSYLVPDDCEVHVLAAPGEDATQALEALADALDAPTDVAVQEAERPGRPSGALTAESVAQALGALLPENAVISDEANTSGLFTARYTAAGPPHDLLCLTGGAIGQGLPVAVGAAVACPDRPVIALEADGSAMYTLQSLWTMARESLDVTTILYNNRSYAVLNMELNRVGAEAGGPKARSMLDLQNPDMDFVALSNGLGVPATRADTAEDFTDQLERALDEPGPHLIEAIVPSVI